MKYKYIPTEELQLIIACLAEFVNQNYTSVADGVINARRIAEEMRQELYSRGLRLVSDEDEDKVDTCTEYGLIDPDKEVV